MKYLTCLILALMLPALAHAQYDGVVGVYSELWGYCLLVDNPGTKTVYVMQKYSVGSTGSRFRVELSEGFTGTLMSFTAPYGSVVGHPLTGATVTLDECLTGDIPMLELQFMMLGTSQECSWIRAAAHPESIDGKIDIYDCISDRHPATWEGTHVQHGYWFCPDLTQGEIHEVPCLPYTPTVASEGATWGAVKALYR